jgi:uncharacterized RDD family membrane protein YckC
MRCPKCHYLSFEPEPRCRNCGYDLAFDSADAAVTPAAPAQTSSDKESLPDVEIRPAVETGALPLFLQGLPDAPATSVEVDVEIRAAAPEAPVEAGASDEAEISEVEEVDEPEPLVKIPAVPRVPLSVRRHTPAPGRVREKYQAHHAEREQQIGLLERDLLDAETADTQNTPWPLIAPDPIPETPTVIAPAAMDDVPESAGAGRRLEAALVDVLFIGSINAGIVWLTLQSCDLTWSQIGLLPILPMCALLFLLDSLYLLMFTATNGQTVGKMAAGIRVVGESSHLHDRVTLKQALLRAVLTFPSVLVLGAGFAPALVGRGLALHDRFTHTRVVRA